MITNYIVMDEEFICKMRDGCAGKQIITWSSVLNIAIIQTRERLNANGVNVGSINPICLQLKLHSNLHKWHCNRLMCFLPSIGFSSF